MQVVIDIDKETLDYIKETGSIYHTDVRKLIKSIKNSTPLPKGHFELIDRKELMEQVQPVITEDEDFDEMIMVVLEEDILMADTIIEVDNDF